MKKYLKINAVVILFHSIFLFITGVMVFSNPPFEVAAYADKFFTLIIFYGGITLLEAIGLFLYNTVAIIVAPFICLFFIYSYIQALTTGSLNAVPFNTVFSINYLVLLILSLRYIQQKFFKKIRF